MLVSAQMSTREVLEELLAERILLLDGSMGALLFGKKLEEEQYRGTRFKDHPGPLKNNPDILSLPRVSTLPLPDLETVSTGVQAPAASYQGVQR